jgi:uncharacterized membrane protein
VQKSRLEAFSDAVIAIIMTIMVLDLRPPNEPTIAAMLPLGPMFLSYLLSFVYLAIYWNNHHHMLHSVKSIDGHVLWANMLLLFWISLVPFATAWMGSAPMAAWPAAVYGIVMLGAALSYFVLTIRLVQANGSDSDFAHKLGDDAKGKISAVIYMLSVGAAFLNPIVSYVGYAFVAAIWFVPDRRFGL